MNRTLCLLLVLFLPGCTPRQLVRPDWLPEVRQCQHVIIMQPGNVGHCLTDEEFRRWVRANMPGQD